MQLKSSRQPVRRNSITESATVMTWGSFFARALSLTIILPVILNRLTSEEISVWLLFSTIITLQMLVDIGFTPTFTRIFAYGLSGVGVENLDRDNKNGSGVPNWDTIEKITYTVNFVFQRVGAIWFLLISTVGTLSVFSQINFLTEQSDGWIAWSIIVCCSFFVLRGNRYVAILQGMNKVAVLRRWEIITSLGASITMILSILLWNNLIAIVAAHQLWQLVNVARNRWLISTGDIEQIKDTKTRKNIPEIFNVVWPSTWRSGLGILMSYGLLQLSGIYYAQRHSSHDTAQFLFALRLVQMLVQFSQAPFYSKLPVFSMLYASNRRGELTKGLERSMFLSHASFTIGFVVLFAVGEQLLNLVGSNIAFPQRMVWMLFGFAFLVERYGAMHIQAYSLTNKIIWHVANGVSGVLFLVFLAVFEIACKSYAIPLSLLTANLLFYSWFSAKHSYTILNESFFRFEWNTSLPAFLVMSILLIYTLIV